MKNRSSSVVLLHENLTGYVPGGHIVVPRGVIMSYQQRSDSSWPQENKRQRIKCNPVDRYRDINAFVCWAPTFFIQEVGKVSVS